MKICIVTPGFGEPTIPFAHHLQERGHSCDVYILSLQGRSNCGTLDFGSPIYGTSIYQLDKNNSIYSYLNKNVNIYNVPYLLERNKKYLIGIIAYYRNLRIARSLVDKIKDNSYDVVLVVAHEIMDAMVCERLKKNGLNNVYIIYHEILKSHFGPQELTDVVKRTSKLGYQLLTYSQHNKNILSNFIPNKIETLYFGPFETYRLYKTNKRIINEDYVLFIGSIQPYKGLLFLYETIAQQKSELPFKIVVAGSGHDEVLRDIEKDSRFILMNKYLRDEEFANLTKYAKCIICPYKAGSQSGITHTAMVYNTPIIATDVAAFPEFVIEGENGSIVKFGDKETLWKEIISFTSSQNIFYSVPRHLEWSVIVSSFEEIIK